MAINSKREQIIRAVVVQLESIPKIVVIKRQRPNLEALGSVPQTMLPMMAVTAGLPVPVSHISRQVGHNKADLFLSELSVEIVTYDMLYDDEKYDERVSEMADDIWVKLWADQTWSGLAEGTSVDPEADVAVWSPYLAFKMICKITYKHTTGGI